MHHTINLGYGDSITIHTPEHAPIKLKAIEDNTNIEMAKKYPIIVDVCNATGITIEQIISPRRLHDLVLARCYITYHLMKNYELTLGKVAKLLCRDHTTIIHYKKLYDNLFGLKDSTAMHFLKQMEQYEKDKN